jgi:hypothetical protein
VLLSNHHTLKVVEAGGFQCQTAEILPLNDCLPFSGNGGAGGPSTVVLLQYLIKDRKSDFQRQRTP